jgi:hypothetical protein
VHIGSEQSLLVQVAVVAVPPVPPVPPVPVVPPVLVLSLVVVPPPIAKLRVVWAQPADAHAATKIAADRKDKGLVVTMAQ